METTDSFVAECFWPGVGRSEVDELDRRAAAVVAELSRAGRPIRYLGSILMREDEVVLCQFAGEAGAVREAAERARIPFERIVATSLSQPAGCTGPAPTQEERP